MFCRKNLFLCFYIHLMKKLQIVRTFAVITFIHHFPSIYNIILAQTPGIGQGLARILSCEARKPE